MNEISLLKIPFQRFENGRFNDRFGRSTLAAAINRRIRADRGCAGAPVVDVTNACRGKVKVMVMVMVMRERVPPPPTRLILFAWFLSKRA